MKTWLVTVILYSLCLFFTPSAFSDDKIYFGYLDDCGNPLHGYYEGGKFVKIELDYEKYNNKTLYYDHPKNIEFYNKYKGKKFNAFDSTGNIHPVIIKEVDLPSDSLIHCGLDPEMKSSRKTVKFPLLLSNSILKIEKLKIEEKQSDEELKRVVIKRVNSFYNEIKLKRRDEISWKIKTIERYSLQKVSSKKFMILNVEVKSVESGFKSVKTAFFILDKDGKKIEFENFSNPYDGPSSNFFYSIVPRIVFQIKDDPNIYALAYSTDEWERQGYILINMNTGQILLK